MEEMKQQELVEIGYLDLLVNNPYSFHKNRTFNKIGEYYSSFVDTSLYDAHFFQPPPAKKELGKMRTFLAHISPNAGGEMMISVVSQVTKKGMDIYTLSATYDLLKIKAAVRLYHLQTGTYPKSLDALTSILGKSLIDPFQKNKKPYGYDPLKGIAWSIGTDFMEDPFKAEGQDLFNPMDDYKEIVLQLFEPEH